MFLEVNIDKIENNENLIINLEKVLNMNNINFKNPLLNYFLIKQELQKLKYNNSKNQDDSEESDSDCSDVSESDCSDGSNNSNSEDSESEDSDVSEDEFGVNSLFNEYMDFKSKEYDKKINYINKNDFLYKTVFNLDLIKESKTVFFDTNNVLCKLKNNKDVFIKISPIIDPLLYIKKYLNHNHTNCLLPNNNYYKLIKKINTRYNSCYIETLISYLLGQLVEKHICIGVPKYYTSFNGSFKDFIFDISEEYEDIKNKDWFKEKRKLKLFEKIDLYDTKEESKEDSKEDIEEESKENIEEETKETKEDNDIKNIDEIMDNLELDEEIDENNEMKGGENKDYFDNISECSDLELEEKVECVKFKEYPVNCLMTEKLEYTLDELIDEHNYEICNDEWCSILFQIIFTLIILQDKLKLTHNDLHSSNIMFQKTNKEFIYFNIKGEKYKFKTYGKIVKIIDYGRSIFNYENEWFMSDVFNYDGDAEGQYGYPNHKFFDLENANPSINFSFDLVRLSSTIHERLDSKNKPILKLINKWMKDDFSNNIINHPDTFELYTHITKYCHNAKPEFVYKDSIFEDYKINKLPQNVNYLLFCF